MLMKNLKVFMVVLVTLAIYTMLANSIPQIESEVPEELSFSGEVSAAELVAAGEDLYAGAGGCTACHGLGTRAPNLLTSHQGQGTIGARCGDRVPGEDCKTYLLNSMVDPGAYVVEGFNPIMPDITRTLSMSQIWAMVAYLQDQGGEVTVTAADIQDEGGASGSETAAAPAGGAGLSPATASADPSEILQANGCLACHTMDGQGTQLGPSFDAIGSRVGADYIRSSILDPNADASEGFEALKGVMPPTFGQQLTAAQMEAVVQFLANRQ